MKEKMIVRQYTTVASKNVTLIWICECGEVIRQPADDLVVVGTPSCSGGGSPALDHVEVETEIE
jgi:hypothetical protein